MPLRVVTSSSGLHSKRCPGIGTSLERTGKSVSFGMWHDPRGFLSSFNVRPASSRGETGRSGSLSSQSRGIDPLVDIRREKEFRLGCPGKSVFLSSENGMSGTFCVASRVSTTISNFRRESGISGETLQWERASSGDDGGTSWFYSHCGGILELRRGTQAASCVGPGKSNLPFELRRKAGDCSRVTAGPIDLI